MGVATLTAAAVVAIPPTAPAAAPAGPTAVAAQVQPAPRVELAAAVRSLLTTPPNPAHFADATAAMARLDPAGTSAVVDAPATFNAASDAIVAGYQFLRYWVTYGVQLADYVLGFVPFGYAIADQVNIVYYNLVLPISDSIVYQLVVPVVNDPLNLASYVNGLVAVGQTSVNALINTGVAEFNYFFGWLIPPLPPRPLAVAREMPVVEEASEVQEIQEAPEGGEAPAPGAEPSASAEPTKTTAEPTKTTEPSETTKPSETAEPSPTAEPSESPEPTKTVEPTKTPETPEPTESPKPPTTTAAGGVQAQGEVRGGNGTTTGTTTVTTTTTTGATTTTGTEAGTHPTTAPAPAAAPDPKTADTGPDTKSPAESDEG
ncbi:hypothetical protein B1790_30900 [Mycobacterium sp. AT1]|nr:hypothetical protein B1790_30900 [Mycobacterium sp. AT1]